MEVSGVAIIAGSKNTLDGRQLLTVPTFSGHNRGPFDFFTYSIVFEPSLNKGVMDIRRPVQMSRNTYEAAFVGQIIGKRRLHQTFDS